MVAVPMEAAVLHSIEPRAIWISRHHQSALNHLQVLKRTKAKVGQENSILHLP